MVFWKRIFCSSSLDAALEAEYAPYRKALRSAGLKEETLRKMDPDDRVAALEKAKLNPYHYIFLSC